MPIAFLLDEHLRGPIWQAIVRRNLAGPLHLDVVRVGDGAELPIGAQDSDILAWAAREARIVLSMDRRTMPRALVEMLHSGGHSPGLIMIRGAASIPTVLDCLEAIAQENRPDLFADSVTFIP